MWPSDRMNIKFGTDGWRAVIAEGFTFQNVDRVAQATADFWNAQPPPGTGKTVIVGYDRRFLSDQFGRRVAEVLAGNGFAVVLSQLPGADAVDFLRCQTTESGGRGHDHGQP